ncbi:hypothetical protein [Aeromonas caviae]
MGALRLEFAAARCLPFLGGVGHGSSRGGAVWSRRNDITKGYGHDIDGAYGHAYDFHDAPDATIRELGVFIGTVAKSTTPVGQDYLLPEDIEAPGTLLVYERIQKLVRSPQVRQQFEFVVQF